MHPYLLRNFLLIIISLITLSHGFTQTTGEKQKIKEETNVEALKAMKQRLASEYEVNKAKAVGMALEKGWTIRKEFKDGVIELQGVTEDNQPLYYITHNADAAESVSTDKVHPGGSAGLSLDGTDMTAGEWDAGDVLTTHQEFTNTGTSRVVDMDGSNGTHYHATHVGGTIIGAGIESAAKGMAFEAQLNAYDWDNDDSEMADAAAEGLLISNHSYGYITGWYYDSGSFSWEWYGDSDISNEEDYHFGFYGDYCQEWDQIAYEAPYYLICKSAGNDRGEGPDSGSHPPDGGDNGYDCIGWRGNAKNILTVGAVEDVEGGYSGNPDDVEMTSFSSWGPADDSRIKPDIVGNGYNLYSTDDDSDNAYTSLSGTSMSAPNVTGSLLLLQEHFNENYGNYMKSATLKALAIHTADECGPDDGPDYMYGWGLLNTQSASEVITNRNDSSFIEEKTLAEDETYSREVTPKGNEPLVATIVWTDPPGTPVEPQLDPTEPMLVNDLDLTIADAANENTYHPYKLDAQNPSDAATTGDNDVDNVEKIVVESPTADSYTIEIDHEGTLENGSQDFSLIISGITIEEYTVSFEVSDAETSEPIPGAIINIYGNTLTTNLAGQTSIDLPDGTYSYTVSASGYEETFGEVTVNGSPVTESVEMQPIEYAIMFTVTDANTSEPISGAEITIDGNNLITNNSGEATVYLPNGTYSYSVNADGYEEAEGEVTVSGSAMSEEVALAPLEYTVTFVVSDAETSDPIEGAEIAIEGNTLTTNSSGEATIDLPDGAYSYTVSAEGYEEADGDVTVSGESVTEEVALAPLEYTVTFVVSDAETSDPIEGAEISIDGNTLTTNSSGEATIDLPDGTYSYTVSASDYEDADGEVTVSGESVTEEVMMDFATSLGDRESNQPIKVYPNPTEDQITIELSETVEKMRILINTTEGVRVYKATAFGVRKHHANLNNLPKGPYIIEILINGKSYKKLIILK